MFTLLKLELEKLFRAVQIYIRIETIFQRIDVRALLTAVFLHVAAAHFCVDERRLADRGRGAFRNAAHDVYASDFACLARAFEVYGNSASRRSVANVLHWFELDSRLDLRRLGQSRSLSWSTQSR